MTEGDGWKELKEGSLRSHSLSLLFADNAHVFIPGVYTYPISFPIPPFSPPTMAVDNGTITWLPEAHVRYQLSSSQTSLTLFDTALPLANPSQSRSETVKAERVVLVIAKSNKDAIDGDSAGRRWEDRMQYLITVGGQGSFCVGGVIPVTIVIMPLARVAVH